MIKPNWDIFKAKFSDDKTGNFEWFCYLLFCREHNFPKGVFRYKNQSAIETEPIKIDNKVIGWQSKFYEVPLSQKNSEILETIEKAKRDYPDLTDLVFYTNQEWAQNKGKEPKGKTDAETRAKELNIAIDWRVASFFDSEFVCITHKDIAKYFFSLEEATLTKAELTRITFENLNKEYTTPLTCSGLNEKDVLVCPINDNYIDEAINNLELSHKCIIKGSSGSGKSLLTYQIAKKLYDQNFKVYKHDKYNSIMPNYADLDEKILIVVDDSQTLSDGDFEKLMCMAHEDLYILMNWNTDTSDNTEFLRSYPSVEVISDEQVKLIKKYSLEHQDRIITVLKKLNVNVNEKDYWNNIESRIDKASKEKTPWLFNYALTEGWRKANSDMKQLSEKKDLDLVFIVVAFFQILTRDKGVNRKVIIKELGYYNKDRTWLTNANKIIDDYCIKDNELIVHKHYMYAKEVLYIFESYNKKSEKYSFIIEFLKRLLSSEDYVDGHSSLLEFIMFNCKYCVDVLNRDNFTIEMNENLLKNSMTSDAIKIQNLNSLVRINKKNIYIVDNDINIINKWILSASSDTVMPLTSLINTLYNDKIKNFSLTDEMLNYVLSKIAKSNIINSAKFSDLYDRLHLFATETQRQKSSYNIDKTVNKLNLVNINLEIEAYYFSKITTNLGRLNQKWATETISKNIEIIANAFNKDLLKAYELYNDILYYYFGLIGIILEYSKKKNSVLAKKLIKKINTNAILKTFNNMKRFDMQNIATFLIFIAVYDKKKIYDISTKVDFSNLKEIYKNDKELEHYHANIIRVLYNLKSENYIKYVRDIIDRLDYIDNLLFQIQPKYALNALKTEKVFIMHFHGSDGYDTTLKILLALDKEGENDLVLKILYDNKDTIKESIFNNNSNISKYNFLVYIYNMAPNILDEIYKDKEKINSLIQKIYILLRGKKIEKQIGNLYLFFIKCFTTHYEEEVNQIEIRFPSVAKFTL